MLDHAFLAAIETLKRSFDAAMLDGQAGEERLHSDLLGGDLTWEASYSLPGEGKPPRVRADITLDWPTWSQSALRSFQLEGDLDERPELGIEVVVRVQHLAAAPDVAAVRAVLDSEGPELTSERLQLAPPTVEQIFDLGATAWAVEFAYDGTCELTEAVLGDRTLLEPLLSGIGLWVASMLVRLGDLRLAFLPPSDLEQDL